MLWQKLLYSYNKGWEAKGPLMYPHEGNDGGDDSHRAALEPWTRDRNISLHVQMSDLSLRRCQRIQIGNILMGKQGEKRNGVNLILTWAF